MKIYKTKTSESLEDEWTRKDFLALNATWLVYFYVNEGYEGGGFAVWKRAGEFFYDNLSHCSCDGPTAHLYSSDKAPYTWEGILKIAKNYDESKEVIEFIKKKFKV